MMKTKCVKILLVEDNPDDVRLTKYALEKEGLESILFLAKDGDEAERFLKQAQTTSNSEEVPELIILDLNLPKKDGFAVLKTVRATPALQSIPVIVLTTSGSELDIQKSYENHANCFIQKPSDLNDFLLVMRSIKLFWTQTVKLPNLKAS